MDYRALSIEERLKLIEAIRETIVADQDQFEITEEQKAELDGRLAEHRADGDPGSPAHEVFERLRRSLQYGGRSD